MNAQGRLEIIPSGKKLRHREKTRPGCRSARAWEPILLPTSPNACQSKFWLEGQTARHPGRVGTPDRSTPPAGRRPALGHCMGPTKRLNLLHGVRSGCRFTHRQRAARGGQNSSVLRSSRRMAVMSCRSLPESDSAQSTRRVKFRTLSGCPRPKTAASSRNVQDVSCRQSHAATSRLMDSTNWLLDRPCKRCPGLRCLLRNSNGGQSAVRQN